LLFCSQLLTGFARASSAGGAKEKGLSQTPTWAVALVCTFFILVSVLLEKALHRVATWLWEKHKNSLLEALEKIKAELMILGFISLLLTFGEQYILKICIPEKAAASMLPCPAPSTHDQDKTHRRRLAAATTSSRCDEGHEPLIPATGLHQLHILLFFMAAFHILYSFITMMLGRLKIRGWKKWEQETCSHDYEFSIDPSRFRLTHETSFVRQHSSFWTKIPFFFYAGCFLQQFFRSVGRTDYLTLRHGFIAAHLAPGRKFDFQKYIKRSLEDDFKVVVGISPLLWASFVIFLLLNVNGWEALFWASILPVLIILAVSTKLQAILTRMALGITERHAVVQGIPLVHGSDKYFWFNRPQLLLHLLHFALFQVLALFSVPNKTTIACYIYLSSTFVPCCLNAPSFCIECFPANILLLGLVFLWAKILLSHGFQTSHRKTLSRRWSFDFVQLHHTSFVCTSYSDGFKHEESCV
jgi:mlo protein